MNPFNERLNELIFENRNKTYGAYVLRKEYPDRLKIALFITNACLGLILLGSMWMRTDEMVLPKLPGPIPIPFDPPPLPMDPPKPPDPEKKIFPVTPPSSTKTLSIPIVSNDSIQPEDHPKPAIEEPINGKSGGDVNNPGPEVPETGGPSGGPSVEKSKDDDIVLVPDENANMPGGIDRFIARNLRYPSIAVDNKTQGTVFVTFVVEKDGSVNNIEILKGVGDGLEQEAARVIKKMKWSPAKVKGKPARQRFTLPIRFVIP